jgi:hypothetical protein
MAIQTVEKCVIRGDDGESVTFTVGSVSDATLVVQVRPDVDIIRRGLLADPGLVRLEDGVLTVDILSDDFDSLAQTALTVARYSVRTVDGTGSTNTIQTGNFKIFRHPQ